MHPQMRSGFITSTANIITSEHGIYTYTHTHTIENWEFRVTNICWQIVFKNHLIFKLQVIVSNFQFCIFEFTRLDTSCKMNPSCKRNSLIILTGCSIVMWINIVHISKFISSFLYIVPTLRVIFLNVNFFLLMK